MATKIILKRSSDVTSSGIPNIASLDYGELALNYGTGTLYFKRSDNTLGTISGGTLSLTSAQVTSALGYTPYNSTNPSGYITSSELSSYLPLSGGELSGSLRVNTSGTVSTTSHVILKRSGQTPASFGSYPGSWRSSLEIWNNNSTKMLFLNSAENDSEYANIKSVGGGFFIDVGSNGATRAIQIEASGAANFPQSLTQGGNQVLHAGNYTSYSPSLTGSGASGTWGISITGNAASVSGLNAAQFFNNMGNNHNTYTDFNSVPGFGAYYVQAGTNSPTGTGAHQWYGFTLGLGNEYAYSSYASQLYWPRAAQNSDTYLYVRDREGGSWGGWRKTRAGYADSAGSVNAATYNLAGLLINSSGSSSTGGAIAIQQATTEGWTGIFCDFEPYTGWGLWHDNPNNYFSFTSEASTGGIRSFTVPSRSSGNRTAYEKFRVDQSTGDTITGAISYAYGSMRAPIFYDSADTAYYWNPNTSSAHRMQTPFGYLDFGPMNFSWCHFQTDRGAFYFNKQTAHDGGISAYDSNDYAYFPVYYDYNDTGYYCDPNGNSQFWGLRIRGDASSAATDNQITFWGGGSASTTSAIGFKSNSAPFQSPTGNGDGYNTYLTMDTDGRGWVFRRGVGGSDFSSAYTSGWILNNGIWQSQGSMRAPIFYDSNDTGYYLNPNGISQLSYVLANDWFRAQNDTGLYFQSYGNGIWSSHSAGNTYGNVSTYGSGRNGWMGWGIASRWVLMSTGGDNIGIHDNSNTWLYYWNGSYHQFNRGYTEAQGSLRAPIFYDSNDTSYYADPASTSNFKSLNVQGELFAANPTWGGFPLAPNLIHNSYMNKVTSGVPDGYSTLGNITIQAVHPFTKGFEGPYTPSAPAGSVGDPNNATQSTPYWYGVYTKGPRIERGGMGDGWHSYADGNLLKVTGTGIPSNYTGSAHCAIFLPKEINNLGVYWIFSAFVKIVKGSAFTVGSDAGYIGINTGYSISKATCDTGPQGWTRFTTMLGTSQITSIDGLAISMAILPDANGDIEGYIALPYLANVNYKGQNVDSWSGSIVDKLQRQGLYIQPTDFASEKLQVMANGDINAITNVKTPIVYDSNDTGYYVDPAGRRSTNINGFTARTKMTLGLTAKYQVDRADYTGDTNYWTGIMGWGTTDLNDVMTWGSGFFDTWSNPGNQPSGTSHWVGVQAYHYVNGANSGHGWQLCGGPIGNLRFRQSWPHNGAWTTVAMHDRNDGSGGALYAGLYYDAQNTDYYTDPSGTSNYNGLNIITMTVYNYIGVCTSFSGTSGEIRATNNIRAPLFYDTNDTGYYLDPNTTGTSLNVAGDIAQGNGGSNTGLAIYHGAGSGDYGRIRFYQAGTNNQTIHVFPTTWQGGTLASASTGAINLSGANGVTIGNWNTITSSGHWFDNSGISFSAASKRSPIFYDSNDTGYYCDPNSNSNLYRTSTYIAAKDTNGNWATGFQNTPTSSYNFHGDISSGGPSGTWWFYESMRHSNGNNYWGTQIAWGWEDNANRLFQRNISGNSFSAWVEYLNTSQREFAGYLQMAASLRAPIFYDSNDTNYYCDPNSTSNFIRLNCVDGASGHFFRGNGNTANVSSRGINVYSDSGSGAVMAFHRGGYFAVNMGLDSDNVIRIGGWSASSNRWQLDMSGNGTFAGSVTAYSDLRLKDNIETITDALNKVKKIRGITYTRNDQQDKIKRHTGVVAQEVQQVLPEVVSVDNEGILHVAYGNMVGLLIEAVKEQQQQIDKLTKLVEVLLAK